METITDLGNKWIRNILNKIETEGSLFFNMESRFNKIVGLLQMTVPKNAIVLSFAFRIKKIKTFSSNSCQLFYVIL